MAENLSYTIQPVAQVKNIFGYLEGILLGTTEAAGMTFVIDASGQC